MRGVLVTLLPVFAALLACGYDSEERTGPGYAGGYGGVGGVGGSSNDATHASIDTGAALSTEPGRGIGVLLDYEAGGKWHVHVACDTALSGEECFWDILVQTPGGTRVRNVTSEGFEPGDDQADWDSGGARLLMITGNDNDGVFLDTDPAAPLSIDVLLDGAPANAYVYWISDGAMNRGAPTNPIILTPSEP